MKAALTVAAVLAFQCFAWLPIVQAQGSCQFVLGFADLRELIGPEKVGDCLEDQQINPETGNAEQRTSGGLMVWRKADNVTAFTDGGTTWVNGPDGFQSRLNSDRFSWEPEAVASPAGQAAIATPTPAVSGPLPVAPTATPTPQRRSDPALASRCVSLAGDLSEELNRDLPPGSTAGGKAFEAFIGLCNIAVQQHGERGFTCFETAFRRAIRMNRQMPPGSPLAANAANAEYQLCVSAR